MFIYFSLLKKGKFKDYEYEPLPYLHTLNLEHNLMHSFHERLFEHMTHIRKLKLNNNFFKEFDETSIQAISLVEDLEEIDMSNNQLQSLPFNTFYSLR